MQSKDVLQLALSADLWWHPRHTLTKIKQITTERDNVFTDTAAPTEQVKSHYRTLYMYMKMYIGTSCLTTDVNYRWQETVNIQKQLAHHTRQQVKNYDVHSRSLKSGLPAGTQECNQLKGMH